MTDYAEIIVPITKDEQLSTLLSLAALAEMPTTSWQPGSVPLALLQIDAQSSSELSVVIADIAKGGNLEDASGVWLDLLVMSQFNLPRRGAVFAKGIPVLTCASNAGPYSIDPNQLWASDASGHRFNNITGGILATSGTLSVEWIAEFAGQAYNLSPGALTILKTPLPGVTITNPSNWQTRVGANKELDSAYRQKAKDRWPDIGSGATAAAYRLWALSAGVEDVRRALPLEANNLGTPQGGHVTVYLAGAAGAISGPNVATVNTYLQAKRPLCVQVHVASGVNRNIAVTGTLYVQMGFGSSALALAQDALVRLEPLIAIGGTVYRDQLIEVLMEVPGATHVPLSAPASDVVMTIPEIAKFVPTIAVVEV